MVRGHEMVLALLALAAGAADLPRWRPEKEARYLAAAVRQTDDPLYVQTLCYLAAQHYFDLPEESREAAAAAVSAFVHGPPGTAGDTELVAGALAAVEQPRGALAWVTLRAEAKGDEADWRAIAAAVRVGDPGLLPDTVASPVAAAERIRIICASPRVNLGHSPVCRRWYPLIDAALADLPSIRQPAARFACTAALLELCTEQVRSDDAQRLAASATALLREDRDFVPDLDALRTVIGYWGDRGEWREALDVARQTIGRPEEWSPGRTDRAAFMAAREYAVAADLTPTDLQMVLAIGQEIGVAGWEAETLLRRADALGAQGDLEAAMAMMAPLPYSRERLVRLLAGSREWPLDAADKLLLLAAIEELYGAAGEPAALPVWESLAGAYLKCGALDAAEELWRAHAGGSWARGFAGRLAAAAVERGDQERVRRLLAVSVAGSSVADAIGVWRAVIDADAKHGRLGHILALVETVPDGEARDELLVAAARAIADVRPGAVHVLRARASGRPRRDGKPWRWPERGMSWQKVNLWPVPGCRSLPPRPAAEVDAGLREHGIDPAVLRYPDKEQLLDALLTARGDDYYSSMQWDLLDVAVDMLALGCLEDALALSELPLTWGSTRLGILLRVAEAFVEIGEAETARQYLATIVSMLDDCRTRETVESDWPASAVAELYVRLGDEDTALQVARHSPCRYAERHVMDPGLDSRVDRYEAEQAKGEAVAALAETRHMPKGPSRDIALTAIVRCLLFAGDYRLAWSTIGEIDDPAWRADAYLLLARPETHGRLSRPLRAAARAGVDAWLAATAAPASWRASRWPSLVYQAVWYGHEGTVLPVVYAVADPDLRAAGLAAAALALTDRFPEPGPALAILETPEQREMLCAAAAGEDVASGRVGALLDLAANCKSPRAAAVVLLHQVRYYAVAEDFAAAESAVSRIRVPLVRDAALAALAYRLAWTGDYAAASAACARIDDTGLADRARLGIAAAAAGRADLELVRHTVAGIRSPDWRVHGLGYVVAGLVASGRVDEIDAVLAAAEPGWPRRQLAAVTARILLCAGDCRRAAAVIHAAELKDLDIPRRSPFGARVIWYDRGADERLLLRARHLSLPSDVLSVIEAGLAPPPDVPEVEPYGLDLADPCGFMARRDWGVDGDADLGWLVLDISRQDDAQMRDRLALRAVREFVVAGRLDEASVLTHLVTDEAAAADMRARLTPGQ